MGKLLFVTLECDICKIPVTIHGPDEWSCDKTARRHGWMIGKDEVKCPVCKEGKIVQTTLDIFNPRPRRVSDAEVDEMCDAIREMVYPVKKEKVIW
jgi:hypothetical protein